MYRERAEKIAKRLTCQETSTHTTFADDNFHVRAVVRDREFQIKQGKKSNLVVIEVGLPPTGIAFKTVFIGEFLDVDDFLIGAKHD